MTEPTLSVVLVDHRRPDLRRRAVEALLGGTRAPDEVVVVDVEPDPHGSPQADAPDPGAEATVRRLVLEDNPGYAAACNLGSAQTSGDWILFMNADVTVDVDCLQTVLDEAVRDPAVGVATCRLVRSDGRLDHACHRGIPTPLTSLAYKLRLHVLFPKSHRLGHYTMSWLDLDSSHDIEACSGAFLLIRREAYEAVAGWDERYWFFAEDLDLCLRVARAGWRIRFVGSATAVHVKGASSHLYRPLADLAPDERMVRRRVQRAIVDAHDLFYRQHQEASTALPLRALIRTMFTLQRLRLRLTAWQ